MRHVVPLLALLAAPAVAQQLQWAQSPVNGHWYAVTAPMQWSAANAEASTLGAYLATVTSPQEDDWLRALLPVTGPYWLGGYQDTDASDYKEPAGGWRWVTGEPWAYSAWQPGQPNEAFPYNENYLEHNTTPVVGWNDGQDYLLRPAVFEIDSADCDGDHVPDLVELVLGGTDPCLPLSASTTSISVTAGGEQVFGLNAGPTPLINYYLLVGSLSGTTPGLAVDGLTLPLNWDDYLLYTVLYPNSSIPGNASLVNTFGVLTTDGHPTADKVAFVQPAGSGYGLIGQTFHHAYVVITVTPSGSPIVSFVSNAVPLTILP